MWIIYSLATLLKLNTPYSRETNTKRNKIGVPNSINSIVKKNKFMMVI